MVVVVDAVVVVVDGVVVAVNGGGTLLQPLLVDAAASVRSLTGLFPGHDPTRGGRIRRLSRISRIESGRVRGGVRKNPVWRNGSDQEVF